MVENPNSAAQVVSTMAPVIKAFLTAVKEEIPDCKFVYDEGLSYESAVKQFRMNNNLDQTYTDLFPLFAVKRSVLRYAKDAQGRRAVVDRVRQRTDPADPKNSISSVYRKVWGEFDLEFLYIVKDAEAMERFEVSYLSEEGISQFKSVDVDLSAQLQSDQKIFPYKIHHNDTLTEKTINSDGTYYKAVQGKIMVLGHYLVFRQTAKHILHIQLILRELNGSVLSTSKIDAPGTI